MAEIAVALSGGGVRAMLFGLGALRAVIRASASGHELTVLAGVSGGAIGAAYAASRVDIAATSVEAYDRDVLRPAVETISSRSLMFGTWHVTAVIGGAVLSLALAVAFAAYGFGLPAFGRAAVAIVALLVALVIAGWRGLAIERALRVALFPDDPRLVAVKGRARLVLQTTDLGSGEATYLTSRGISSWRWGEADVGGLSVVRAARAAATFPLVFPALHMPHLTFRDGREEAPRRLSLVDGGVYDNMGSEWLLNRRRTPQGTTKIIVNASGNLASARGGFGLLGLGELRVVLREKDIQYDATTAPRRRWLGALFEHGLQCGTLVCIDGNLHDWVSAFAPGDDDRGGRARTALAAMECIPDPGVWERWSAYNPSVPTSLGKLKPATALALVRAGYLTAAVQMHVLEGWPAPETYDPDTLWAEFGRP